MRTTISYVLAAVVAALATGCSGSSIAQSGPNSNASKTSASTAQIAAPLAVPNVAYLPNGGPLGAAAAPGYSQLSSAGLDDSAGFQFWLSNQNVVLDRPSTNYGGSLVDDRAPGASTANSTTVIDFTMSATAYLSALARSNQSGNAAYSCSVGGSQLELIARDNGWRSIAVTTIAPKFGATYAVKFDVLGPLLSCKLFDATGKLYALVEHTDTALTARGFNGLQYYNPDGQNGATAVKIWYSRQPDNVVGIPRGPSGGGGPTPTPVPSATPSAPPTTRPTASPTPHPTDSPTPHPTASPTPHPTASPTPTSAPTGGTGAALLCVHFASNPMCHKLPSNPQVASQSGAWSSLEFGSGRNTFGGLQISNAANPFLDSYDNSVPRYELPVGAATTKQIIQCNKESYSYEVCQRTGMNNKVLYVPADMIPQGASDHHFAYDDFANHGEQDFFLTEMPSGNGGTMSVGGAGFCKWGTDGTGCSGSNATDIALGMGAIDATLLKEAESDPQHGSLPFAVASEAVCNDTTFVYPATGSDGATSNGSPPCIGHTGPGQRPPEGTRWFLAMHDSDVNATNNDAYVKVILRTMDEDHYGGVVTDTNWGEAPEGLMIPFSRGNFAFAAAEAGIYYGTDVFLPISSNGIDLATAVKFCSNGTC
jgi:hypothetical protein